MFMNLISWTGWTKEDWTEAIYDVVGKVIGLIILGAFAYGSMWCIAFLAGC